MNAFGALAMKPVSMLTDDEIPEWDNQHMSTLLEHFGVEKVHDETGVIVPPLVEKNDTMKEWAMAKQYVRSQGYPRDSLACLWKLLSKFHHEELPNLVKLAMLALTSPVHTAECKRGFSVQNNIKSALRNRLSPERLDDLATVAILTPCSVAFSPEKVLGLWRDRRQRKLFS